MRYTTDENEDCREIAERVREIGELEPLFLDDTTDAFREVLDIIDELRKEAKQ
jgi:hypothetical protein